MLRKLEESTRFVQESIRPSRRIPEFGPGSPVDSRAGGLVALEGPGTVVAPEVNLAVSNLMPAWMVARMDRAEGAATVSPARDAFLLVKGESWGFGHAAAAHRSPAATDARRVLLAFDRLCDVE